MFTLEVNSFAFNSSSRDCPTLILEQTLPSSSESRIHWVFLTGRARIQIPSVKARNVDWGKIVVGRSKDHAVKIFVARIEEMGRTSIFLVYLGITTVKFKLSVFIAPSAIREELLLFKQSR